MSTAGAPAATAAAADAADAARFPKLRGQPLERLPEDLYIPPDALEVFLEAFEGPLDLLLYLIRKQNLDVLDIPVLTITRQYMQYIGLMRQMRLDLAAEYLVMAAWLAEIKSRLLLPKPVPEDAEQGDPRMELVRRLQEYERFKTAAENLDALPRVNREIAVAHAPPERVESAAPLPVPSLRELLSAMREVLLRADLYTRHQVAREPLSVRERMTSVLERVQAGPRTFLDIIDPAEGPAGVVVCLLAVLELVKLALIQLVQESPFAQIRLGAGKAQDAAP